MKKNIIKAFALAACICSGALVSSCSDPGEVNDLVLARVLSPTGISARVSNNLNIIVSWNEMSGATSYKIEAYADTPDYGTRTPDITKTTTLTEDTLANLVGETTYYIRVQALDANDSSRDSKWVTIDRTTGSEQNMKKVTSGDVTGTSVKLKWDATTVGNNADHIIISPTAAGSTVPTVTYEITATDLAAGTATVTGLQPQTSYKAVMKYGEKTRGTASFKTTIDLSDAIVLGPTDDWKTTIESAPAGSKYALKPGNYSSPTSALVIGSNVIIGSQDPANPAVLNTYVQLNNGASLYLMNIKLNGADTKNGTSDVQAFEYKTAGNFGDLTLDGCEIYGHVKGLIYINVAAIPDNIKIDNCIIHDIVCTGGDFIDSRKGGWNKLTVSNSTFYNCATSRDWFRADVVADITCAMTTTVDHNTFYNCGSGKANYRIFYTRNTNNNQSFTNNIVAGFQNTRGFANGSINVPTYSHNYYYNCVNLVSLAEGNTQTGLDKYFDTEGTTLTTDPFEDAANHNFYIKEELLRSYEFGDPRWY